ncbi:MAG: FAD-dependent oxidoreductase [Lentimicrobiaceae bacterium]|nr:FAD-dependent oxidoreductase [Lentimicrobiaceae bacterium]
MNKKLTLCINGKEVTANAGETILNVCKSIGIEIPHLCHDPKLKPFSSCFLCVVAIKGFKTHQPSCSTIVQEGMEIETYSPEIFEARQAALELLLSNHYADCVAPCKLTCPAGVDVQGYLSLIEKGLYAQAVALIKETNPLPAICGRVCVRPCEGKCRRQFTEDKIPVGIDYLKRYVADSELLSDKIENKSNLHTYIPKPKPLNGKKIAIIGGGPAGLTAAYYLQLEGFQADIYERAEAAGGWLRYGIPEYRLPNAILDQEIENITKLGVNIFTNKSICENVQIADLDKNYDALFIAIGAQNGDLLGIGEKPAPNLVSGIDFLKRNAETNNDTNLQGKRVVVVGGGNTAMDCCRSARRCGSEDVIVLYRRTEADMPANPIEIHESKVEGVEYIFLAAPTEVYYNEKDELTGLKCIKMKAEKVPGSRRSNIVPIEGSEFDLPCDLVLPATGQKIQYEILDHINRHFQPQELQLNKWKTLDANETTMQMNIPKIFAAGDAVTGPTNIIEAIAGGKAAAKYIGLFLLHSALDAESPTSSFISTKDNFEKQVAANYEDRFVPHARYEMPVLPENERHNFKEVELGYQDETLAKQEANRCLECGCSAFYDCLLQKYCTDYNVDQNKYKGKFQKFEVNFHHPKIELDNNKCVLCGRCVRVCQEYSGNKAWAFFKRGSQTYVTPNLEGNLTESRCDACGLCVDTCPTGALRENFTHKILPLPYQKLPAIDPFGSEGFEVDLLEYKGNIYGANARYGFVNQYGLINRHIKFEYDIFNRKDRITQPLLRENGTLKPITKEEAIKIMHSKTSKLKLQIPSVKTDGNEGNERLIPQTSYLKPQTAVLVSPQLTNEAMYLIQKFVRTCLDTNSITSSYFMQRQMENRLPFNVNKNDNLPVGELHGAKRIYIVGSDLAKEHPVISHLVQNSREENHTPVTLIATHTQSTLMHRVDNVLYINDERAFVTAVNYYILKNNLEAGVFVNGLAQCFYEYKTHILSLNYDELLQHANVSNEIIAQFVKEILETPESAFIFSEKSGDLNTFCELKNLMLLTEKQGKTFCGLMLLKPDCNTQGLYDMGMHQEYGPGFQKLESDYIELLMKTWNVETLPADHVCPGTLLGKKEAKNVFIFGDNIVESHPFTKEFIEAADFVCMQSVFENETTALADLILPMNFAIELGGSFTSSFKVAQPFEMVRPCPFNWNDYRFYAQLMKAFGVETLQNKDDIFLEMITLLQPECCSVQRHQFEF